MAQTFAKHREVRMLLPVAHLKILSLFVRVVLRDAKLEEKAGLNSYTPTDLHVL